MDKTTSSLKKNQFVNCSKNVVKIDFLGQNSVLKALFRDLTLDGA